MTTTPTELLTPEQVADMYNASLSDRHMDAVKPFTADVMRIMRDAGMTFHLGLPHDKVIEQMTRVVDLAYAEASIKAAVVFSAPAQQPLTSWQRRQIIMSVKTVGEAIDMVEAIHNITRPTIPAPQLEAAQALIDHQAAQALGKEGGAA